MNRAERRRQEKTARKSPAPKQGFPVSREIMTAIKAELQQATSPEAVQHITSTLVAQGLPPTAGQEL
jgi:hypothetical protein